MFVSIRRLIISVRRLVGNRRRLGSLVVMPSSPSSTPDAQGKPGARENGQPRRAPGPEERQRDAERSRERLIAAALDEFSAHGYAGARVSAIARRAGLNQQLIAYYFGGKEGLYRALEQRWLEQEATISDPAKPLPDVIADYAAFADPRGSRLLLWTGLTGEAIGEGRTPADSPQQEDLTDLRRRQAAGEIASDLDPALLELALMGAILAPIALPQVVRRVTGQDPDDPDFQARYTEQLRLLTRHLAEGGGRGRGPGEAGPGEAGDDSGTGATGRSADK
jgi:AcrR family transcriptional regulator